MKAGKVIIIILCTMIIFTGCSAKKNAQLESKNMSYSFEEEQVVPKESESKVYGINDSIQNTASTGSQNEADIEGEMAGTKRKLIMRITLELQTLEFDNSMEFINRQMEISGGYMESSQISGNTYQSSGNRYAELIMRIPSTKVDEFLKQVDENTFVVNRKESTEDITLKYVDTQSHVKALEIEQDRLIALLEKADKLEDIIALEERLSSVRYEIENYGSTLRTFDNLVSYSTVTLHLSEVTRVVPKEEKNAFSRMGIGIKESFLNIRDGFVNFMVWFVVSLPYFIIWGGVLLVVALIVRKTRKRTRRPSAPMYEEKAPEQKKSE